MKMSFKEWVKRKIIEGTKIKLNLYPELTLEDFIRCIWAINRGGEWIIELRYLYVHIENETMRPGLSFQHFRYKSEQEALTAALEYVCKHKKK